MALTPRCCDTPSKSRQLPKSLSRVPPRWTQIKKLRRRARRRPSAHAELISTLHQVLPPRQESSPYLESSDVGPRRDARRRDAVGRRVPCVVSPQSVPLPAPIPACAGSREMKATETGPVGVSRDAIVIGEEGKPQGWQRASDQLFGGKGERDGDGYGLEVDDLLDSEVVELVETRPPDDAFSRTTDGQQGRVCAGGRGAYRRREPSW